jgi:hypothetical protein
LTLCCCETFSDCCGGHPRCGIVGKRDKVSVSERHCFCLTCDSVSCCDAEAYLKHSRGSCGGFFAADKGRHVIAHILREMLRVPDRLSLHLREGMGPRFGSELDDFKVRNASMASHGMRIFQARRLSTPEGCQLIQVASRPRSQQEEHLQRETDEKL